MQLLDFYSSIADENGFIRGSHGTFGGFVPGWSTRHGPERKGVAAYAQIMLYYNYEIGAYFADLWREKSLVAKYRKQAQALKAKIFEHFWDKENQCFQKH